jgi:hypothetical protein
MAKDGPKKPNVGPQKKTAKGAHGGGIKYHQHESKYPNFGFGQGFKQKPKPGPSTENKQKLS